jgi:hypothetical protein
VSGAAGIELRRVFLTRCAGLCCAMRGACSDWRTPLMRVLMTMQKRRWLPLALHFEHES